MLQKLICKLSKMIIKAVKYFLSLLLFLAFAFSANAYYNPGSPTGFVNDYAGVLKADQKQALESKLSQFEKDSSNEISVVIIPNLQDDTIENFAVELFKDWGIGKKGNDNGVLILVALQDRKMRIEVGYGLEGALTDAQANWIINNTMKPAFRENDFYKGIDEATNKIISATKGEYVPSEKVESSIKDILDYALIAVFVFIYILRIFWDILGMSKSYWAGGLLGILAGGAFGFFFNSVNLGILFACILGGFGLAFDYLVSRVIKPSKGRGGWFGGFWGGGGGGGGFGGFGGGGSGGGGSSGSW